MHELPQAEACGYTLLAPKFLLQCLALLSFFFINQSAAFADPIDDYVAAKMERMHIPGLALAVVRDGKVIKARGYGFANLELKVRVTPRTIFQLQSITKSFTATAIMMLMEEGKLRLDDPVGKHLEGAPEAWKDITVRHLLTHTSGIKDFINEPVASLRLDVTEEEVFKQTAPRPLNFPPGERYAYSNTGYHLLGMIIRKITGKAYGEFLKERIFDPLGMEDTRINVVEEVLPNRASGYRWVNGKQLNGLFVAPSILAYAGGGVRSTVLDLEKWYAELYTEKLLKRSTLEQMWKSAVLNNARPTNYGLGWNAGERRGHRMVGHGGSHMTGFTTDFTRWLDDRITFIVLTNQRAANPNAIVQGLARLYVPELSVPTITDTDPEATTRLERALRDLLAGRLKPELFAPELRARLFPDQVKQLRAELKICGRLKSFLPLAQTKEGEVRRYRYRVQFTRESAVLRVTLNGDGLIAEVAATYE